MLTARGGATSHAAVVARQIGKPCVAGVGDLTIDQRTRTARIGGRTLTEGDVISLDGSTGEVFLGALPTVEVRFEEQAGLLRILDWADTVRQLQVWTNADKPEEAALARRFGAEGIGLCRTEHMFREGERLDIVRDAILVAMQATRAKQRRAAGDALDDEQLAAIERFDAAMGRLERLQEGDFRGIFAAMSGLPGGGAPDRPAAPRVPARSRAADRAGDAPRDARHAGRRPRARRGQCPAAGRGEPARAEPDARACAAAAWGS